MKILMFTLLILCCQSITFAQTVQDEYSRFEFYGGFSYTRFKFDRNVSPISTVPDGLPMLELSATYNVNRYVGLKGAFTAGIHTKRFFDVFPPQCRPGDLRPQCACIRALTCPDPAVDFKRRASLYEFFGGVQLKDNSREVRIKPVAHALLGIARLGQVFYPNPDDPNPPLCPACVRFHLRNTGFAMDVGGGLDVSLTQRIDLRVVQASYNPTFLGGGIQHNFRVGAGIIFR